MLMNSYLISFRQVFLMLLISLTLAACDKSSEDVVSTVAIPTLSDQNIKAFTLTMAKEYNANLNSLVAEFNAAKKQNNAYSFVSYRNHKWTPHYIDKKDYYQKVLAQNESYLSHSPSRPLFEKFEGLIYIGINLKNALVNNDDARLQQAMTQIEEDQSVVKGFVK